MHFEHIHVHSKLHVVTPPHSSPVPYPSPNFTSLLIQSIHKLQLVLRCEAIHREAVNLPEATPWKKTASLCPLGHERFIVSCLGRGWTPPQPVLGYWLAGAPEGTTMVQSHTRRGCYFADSPSSYSLNEEYLLAREPQQRDCFTGSNNTRHCHITLCFWTTTRHSAFPL